MLARGGLRVGDRFTAALPIEALRRQSHRWTKQDAMQSFPASKRSILETRMRALDVHFSTYNEPLAARCGSSRTSFSNSCLTFDVLLSKYQV